MIIKTCETALSATVAVLKRPGAVALVPTETVYGLVCDWNDKAARARIYELKHRAENKPFAAFVPNLESLPPEVDVLPLAARKICEAFCPGPVTLVVPDKNGSTFGFRIPDHPFILKLLREYGGALASTSANLSGAPAALSVDEALESIDGEPEIAVDGGVLPADSKASTVILVNVDSTWRILRPGPVSEQSLKNLFFVAGTCYLSTFYRFFVESWKKTGIYSKIRGEISRVPQNNTKKKRKAMRKIISHVRRRSLNRCCWSRLYNGEHQ